MNSLLIASTYCLWYLIKKMLTNHDQETYMANHVMPASSHEIQPWLYVMGLVFGWFDWLNGHSKNHPKWFKTLPLIRWLEKERDTDAAMLQLIALMIPQYSWCACWWPTMHRSSRSCPPVLMIHSAGGWWWMLILWFSDWLMNHLIN